MSVSPRVSTTCQLWFCYIQLRLPESALSHSEVDTIIFLVSGYRLQLSLSVKSKLFVNFTVFNTPMRSDSGVYKAAVFNEMAVFEWHILPVIMFPPNLYGSLVQFSAKSKFQEAKLKQHYSALCFMSFILT